MGQLTPRGAKATLLSMLAKFGAGPLDRLVLGHHSTKSFGALEVYSRDLQAGPLRILLQMIDSVREGRFHPDRTGSGQFFNVEQAKNMKEGQVEQELVTDATHGQSLAHAVADPPPEDM